MKEVEFCIVNSSVETSSGRLGSALLRRRYNGAEKEPLCIIHSIGGASAVLRQITIDAVLSLKEPCHIKIYCEPTFGISNSRSYVPEFDDALTHGGHSYEYFHFMSHPEYKQLKSSSMCELKMIMAKTPITAN